MVSNDNDGFFLMIEGSQIDWVAEHNGTDYLLSEINDFLSAIDESLKFAMINQNTLIVFTSDYDTGSLGIIGFNKGENN